MDKTLKEKLDEIKRLILTESEKSQQLILLEAKKYLSVDDMTAYTGLSKSIIYRKMRAKEIPFSKPSGKLAFFKKSDVDAWLGSNRIASANEVEEQATRYCVAHKKGGAA